MRHPWGKVLLISMSAPLSLSLSLSLFNTHTHTHSLSLSLSPPLHHAMVYFPLPSCSLQNLKAFPASPIDLKSSHNNPPASRKTPHADCWDAQFYKRQYLEDNVGQDGRRSREVNRQGGRMLSTPLSPPSPPSPPLPFIFKLH
jgi:hypothetical protein